MSRVVLCFLVVVGVVARCRAQETAPSAPVHLARIAEAPSLDGVLDDAVWQQATVVSDFEQRLPVEGAPPLEETDVFLAYTTDALYVGLHAYHTHPEDIVATAMRRDDFDQIVKNEQFVIAIDSYNDGRNGYWFSTNPLGVRVDAQFFNDGDLWESNWDGLWECRARIDATGWTAEIEIPFSTLRFAEGDENVMGINLYRRVIKTNEQLFAPLIPLRLEWGTPNVSAARKYVFEGITGGRSVQVKPFAVGGLTNDNFDLSRGLDTQADVGLDVRYGLTDNLTANVSINTDFAQAEVDERQINLTRFSLFFPEKRDFFLENAGTFTFGIPEETEIFFSRRIGLARDSTGGVAEVPILAGAKVTGQIGGTDVGLIDVQTRSSSLASAENYGVARVKVGVAPRSYVGGIVTSKVGEGGYYNRVYGGDATLFLVGDVGVSGFAATATTSARDYRLEGASAFNVSLFKGGERTSFKLSLLDVGSAFDPAIGFVPRAGVRKWSASLKVPWYVQTPRIRRITPGFETTYYDGHDGQLQTSTNRLSVTFDAPSEDQAVVAGVRSFEYLPFDFQIFHDVVIPAGGYTFYDGQVMLTTKPGRVVSGTLLLTAGSFYGGTRQEAQASVEWKADRHLTVGQFYDFGHVDLDTGSFRTHLVRTRLNFALNTHLSVASLIQYDNATEQLGLNLRLGYLFREGTELFLVYNDTLDGPARLDPFRLGSLQSRTILFKLTYLFDL